MLEITFAPNLISLNNCDCVFLEAKALDSGPALSWNFWFMFLLTNFLKEIVSILGVSSLLLWVWVSRLLL